MTQWIRPFAPLLLFALAGASVLGLWALTQRPIGLTDLERMDEDMSDAIALREHLLPPIDEAAVKETETATFAMG
jgi:hypothetical protein